MVGASRRRGSGRTRVLIVDDDALVRAILSDLLGKNGYDTQVATSAEQAIAMLRTAPFEVMLADLNLPAANGLQLVLASQTVAPDLRTVVMSASASAKDFKVAERLGVVDLLVKPFPHSEVLEAIRRAEHRAAGFQASFDGLSITDVLQLCHQLRKSTTVLIEGIGAIYFEDGELVHAEAGIFTTGHEALVTLLDTASGHLSLKAPKSMPHTLKGSFDNILLRAVTALEDQRRERGGQRFDESDIDDALLSFGDITGE